MELVLFFFTTNTWTMLKKQLLNKALSLKQQFIEQIEMTVKIINIKNRTYYFFNDMINIKIFDSNLLKIDKKSYKNIGIYYIGYTTIQKIDNYEHKYTELWDEIKYLIKTINGCKEGKYKKRFYEN